MDGHFVKADSVVEFLDAFLPYPSTAPKRRTRRKNPFENLVDADKWVEAEVFAHFAVTSQRLCPKLVLTTSERTPDPKGVDKTQQKVDAGFFHPDDAPTNGQPGWPFDLVPVEFKNRKQGNIYDPLDDKAEDEGFESQADSRKDVRGQLTTYSELGHELQHRIFLLMLLVIGRRYRLMRWDRAGTVVTPSIDYYENPDDLCEFLWRISHLDDEALGLDPTAIRLKGDAFDELDTIAKPLRTDVDHTPRVLKEHQLVGEFCYRYVREMFAASIQDRALPRYKLHISMGDTLNTFLVGKPAAVARGMVGRGTRGWVAWHCEGGCFVWLKDAWRVSFEGIEREGDILARLNRAKISSVPTLVCHGDVGGQMTLTADWWKRRNGNNTATSAAPTSTPGEPSSADQAKDDSRKRKRPLEDEGIARPAEYSLRRGPRRACRGSESPDDTSATANAQPSALVEPAEPAPGKTSTDPAVYAHDCHIRRHTHYRMAVAEVGMPLKEIMNGRQLATILLDCIGAHHGAATSRSLGVLLHRDVSDKNILIYPKIKIKGSKKGKRSLVWGGILTDWEISKPIPKFGDEQRARQPVRTGRWQFMSANLLMNPLQRVMIEDELESFFHILVYYAVRYLKSSLLTDDDAAHFLEACFDCFAVHNKKVTCGSQKLYLVKYGEPSDPDIVFIHPMYMGDLPITFGSEALNILVAAMIPCLRARYKVLAWNEWLKSLPKDNPAHPQCKRRYETPPPQGPSSSHAGDERPRATCTRGAVDNEQGCVPRGTRLPPPPTKDDWKDAMRIASHNFIKAQFRSALEDGTWNIADRVGDRVPSDYDWHFITAVRTHHLTPGSTLSTVPFNDLSTGREGLEKHRIHVATYRCSDVPKRGHPVWADQKVSFQFSRYVAGADPFEDNELDEDYTDAGRERKKLRNHVFAAAELLFASQQRISLFMVLIIGRRFRLLRWDRSGVIVTPSIDYVEQSALLCDCLRRLSLLDDLSLGIDPTATRLRPRDADFKRMDAAALDDPCDVDHTERRLEEDEIGEAFVFRYVRSSFRDSLSADWPRYRLRVPDRDNTREFLVGKPLHLPSGAIGRGTRGYVALDCKTQRFVWLKDAWRASDLVIEKEGDILERLNLAGVANVPTLVCHGDIQEQITVTNKWWDITHDARPSCSSAETASPGGQKRKRDERTSAEGSLPNPTVQAPTATARQPCPLRRHTHYRIAVEEVAMPLAKFRCGKQLASVALDCLRAHHQAATHPKTSILHRDISSANMLIYPKVRPDEGGKGQSMCWTGILTDWELAKPVDTPRPMQANRVGTHQFMSVNLLGNPFQAVAIPDELESFFHVLVYYSVFYLRSNCPIPDAWINTYFLANGMPNMYTGGMKTALIRHEGRLTTLAGNRPPFPGSASASSSSSTSAAAASASATSASSTGVEKTNPEGAAAAKKTKPYVPTPSFSDDSDYAEIMAEWKQRKPPDTTPTPEERELAHRVENHDFTLDFIAEVLCDKGWSDDDRLSPRPAPASNPHSEPEPEPEPARADAAPAPAPKRRRKAAPKEKTVVALAQTGPTTARQTRSQTRATSSKTRPGRKS
ncbi:hypothetical protein GSI_05179 [Ganoderma sinense ZZ0214-1]|uniref:Fungal-type protein kinase domain-containing protein n=1 Tax=Ganoderma sinense ZZ0214-1 TaxID=1077348 RepID=A0A2G8SFC3_9APHY|nr:hypothetical protein GSI_05179 [Ganoderma sinense ZZ0214-1]